MRADPDMSRWHVELECPYGYDPTDRGRGVAEHEDRIADLQGVIRERHEALGATPAGDPGYPEAASRVLDATFDLIAFEERLPLLLDEPRRRSSLLAVRSAGWLAIAVAVAVGLATIPGWIERWWLLLLVPMALLGVGLQFVRVRPPGGRHLEQRTGAVLIGLAVVPVPLLATGVVSAWAVLAVIAVAAAGALRILRVGTQAARPSMQPSTK